MGVRFALGWAAVLAGAAAWAGPLTLDPEMKAMYTWRVVVQVKPHPTLGAAVRAQLLKDLRAALNPVYGTEMGTVEVIDLDAVPKGKWEPLWAKFAAVGWPALEMDEFRTLTGVKTHFLTVRFDPAVAKYVLESKQHDGCCGLASPQVRTKVLPDLDKIDRAAALLVGNDFGPVGTVEPLPETKTTCLLKIRGGELPGMDKMVRPGDVFALSVVNERTRTVKADGKPGGKDATVTERVAQPQSYTLLRVLDLVQTGIAKCEILSRFDNPLVDRRGLIGYRARKLATRDDRLTIRIVDKDNKPPAASTPLEVWATDNGFRDTPTPSDTLSAQKDRFVSGRNLRGLACVYVKLGSGVRQRYVLPVLDGATPQALTFTFDEGMVRAANFENECERVMNRAIDARLSQDELFVSLKGLIEKSRNKEAFDRATKGVETARAVDAELSKQIERLRADKQAADGRAKRLLDAADQWLTNLKGRVPDLEAKIGDLKVAVEKASNPAEFEKTFRLKELTRQIDYHVDRGEVPEALDLYDKLYAETKEEEVRTRRQKLEAEWRAKTPEQEKARAFLNDDWPKLETLEGIKGGVQQLKQAVDTLTAAQDRLGLKLAVARIQGGYARLNEVVNTLDPEGLVQDKVILADAKSVFDAVRKIDEAAQAEVKKLEGKK
jgi:outer membrane murein-binding lipoprotein Lpp